MIQRPFLCVNENWILSQKDEVWNLKEKYYEGYLDSLMWMVCGKLGKINELK